MVIPYKSSQKVMHRFFSLNPTLVIYIYISYLLMIPPVDMKHPLFHFFTRFPHLCYLVKQQPMKRRGGLSAHHGSCASRPRHPLSAEGQLCLYHCALDGRSWSGWGYAGWQWRPPRRLPRCQAWGRCLSLVRAR